MDRRKFLQSTTGGAVAASTAGGAAEAKTAPKKVLMKVGTQHGHSEEILALISAFGVNNICTGVISPRLDEKWSVEGLAKLRERVESHGIKLDCVPIPLSSSYITKSETPSIMLAGPTRDQDIDNICQMIRNCSKAGIPMVKYNMTILGVVRTQSTPGRGSASFSTFDYAKAIANPSTVRNMASTSGETAKAPDGLPLTEAGVMSAEKMWERITYFLKRVVPVAEEYKVKIACHPHDPGMPMDKGYRGVIRVLGHPDGLKRFIEISPSKYHGINFCQGTVSEMLKDPNKELPDVIRYFGSRGKIFNVHFRNIKGGFLKFQETFPDDGDVDFVKIIRIYRDIGYDGMLMPDHVPHIPGDTNGYQAFAYAFGYINALIQMVKEEA
jgi:mannonate dehydratase